ncbi:MAG: hypothetical protein HLUCCO17_09015 [Saliniramus fredricksonii]|uniref:Lipoprotein n=2 Tax=Saliniramus fredricksonii TaxID=1653334 RepID=A0A0N8KEA8_9HYPH|nr:MAG: hypothetical protein HLUCCO17_09015 [Saliniramus fredricksonii]
MRSFSIVFVVATTLGLASCQTIGSYGRSMASGYGESRAVAERCPDYEMASDFFTAAMVVCLTSKEDDRECEMEEFMTHAPRQTQFYRTIYSIGSDEFICQRAESIYAERRRSFLKPVAAN